MSNPSNPCTIVRPGEGKRFWLIHDLVTPLVSASKTGDRYEVVHNTSLEPGGPPPHVHSQEDELFYVLEGQYRFIFNDQTFEGGPGTCVFLPRGIVHTFNRVGDKPGKLMVAITPGGFGKVALAASLPCSDPSVLPELNPAYFDRLMASCAAHGIEFRPNWKPDKPAPAQPKRRELWVVGLHIKILLTSEETRGSFTMVEIIALPGGFVPKHYHHREDEMFYVLDGTFEFELDGQKHAATPGTFFHIPRKTLHGFRNVGTTNGRLLNYHTPGGFDRFFEASGTVCDDFAKGPPTTPVDLDRFVRICNEHGMEVPR